MRVNLNYLVERDMTSWFLLVPLLSRAGAGAGAGAEQLRERRNVIPHKPSNIKFAFLWESKFYHLWGEHDCCEPKCGQNHNQTAAAAAHTGNKQAVGMFLQKKEILFFCPVEIYCIIKDPNQVQLSPSLEVESTNNS